MDLTVTYVTVFLEQSLQFFVFQLDGYVGWSSSDEDGDYHMLYIYN